MEWWEFEHHKHRAKSLEFTFSWECDGRKFKLKGECMQFSMVATNTAGNPSTVSVVGSPVTAQVDSAGNPIPSKATLTATNYASSDPTVFTVAVDPNTPNGAIITSVGPGTATLTETATATEPDGKTTEQIQGVATIILTAAPPPPPPPAASLVFTFGTPK